MDRKGQNVMIILIGFCHPENGKHSKATVAGWPFAFADWTKRLGERALFCARYIYMGMQQDATVHAVNLGFKTVLCLSLDKSPFRFL